MIHQLQQLAGEILELYPGAEVELETFPSGGGMLDVRWKERLFVLDYAPSRGFGVDEVKEGEGFNSGYVHVLEDFAAAKSALCKLLLEEIR